MNDNALGILIRQTLLAQLAVQGYPAVRVLSNYQPTSQGRETGPVIYFFPILDNAYGWQSRSGIYDADVGEVVYTETQRYETAYQMMSLAPSDPADLSLPTAKDLLSVARQIVASQLFVNALTENKVGLQRPTQIRTPFFVNDQQQFEASPSFDFTVSRERSIIQQVPAFESTELNQTRV